MGRRIDRLVHAFNAFTSDPDTLRGPPPPAPGSMSTGASYGARPYSTQVHISNERSLLASIISTMSVDVSDIELRHAETDDEGGYLSTKKSGLQYCFSKSANLDQAARAFRRDIAMTLFHHGVAAVVPVETTGSNDPLSSDAYDVKTMRVGQVVQWYPHHVRVLLYNDRPDKGIFEELTLPKRFVAIVENPFYEIMNKQNSTLQRIIRKLALLDVTDEKASAGKLNLIMQLPYAVRNDMKRQEAETRIGDIEFQLSTGKYGIAYADSTEKITQLNRPLDNNLWEQIEGLTTLLFSQLGITQSIMDGTADENTMTNYMARTIEPIVDAIAEEFERKFLSKTAVTQGEAVLYFRDPFKLIPITRLAEIADVMSRNEIFTPNDVLRAIGMKPNPDPKADMLYNSNMPARPGEIAPAEEPEQEPRFVSSQMISDEEAKLDAQMKQLGV
jgi:hypothetical protein